MNLLEYEAKTILDSFSIPVPKVTVIRSSDVIPSVPIVLKSQVHSGGRGKAGGVRIVTDQSQVAGEIESLFALPIKGELPRTLLAETLLDIAHEYYLSLIVNRATAEIELVAHLEGGIEVESHDSDEFFRKPLGANELATIGESLSEYFDLPGQAFVLQDLVENLRKCFITSDATLLEINPLILTKQNEIIAGDCKMILDDDAAFRHTDWTFEQEPASANFVTLDRDGTIATIANGAGLAMATVDAVKDAGLAPANFLDIGGGATVDGIVRSFASILEFPRINAIVINIFGGIVRCDDVAAAILEARKQFPHLPELYIRLSGTRSAEAAELLASEQLTLYPDLPSCLKELTHE